MTALTVLLLAYLAGWVLHLIPIVLPWKGIAGWVYRVVCLVFVFHGWHLAKTAHSAILAHGAPLSSWRDWCLIGAWIAAAAYVLLGYAKVKDWQGVFVLPLVVALLAVAHALPDDQAFSSARAYKLWGVLHGTSLLLGTIATSLGFSAGVMYLVQAYQLKHKVIPGAPARLPTLETLERANEWLLLWSVLFLLVGILAGVLLNWIGPARSDVPGLSWSDPAVLTSGLLGAWLFAVGIFATCYKPARRGRKVAYLTVSSFVVLMLTLVFVLFGPTAHARGVNSADGPSGTRGGHRTSEPAVGSLLLRTIPRREDGKMARPLRALRLCVILPRAS